jgi:ribosome recycling factor
VNLKAIVYSEYTSIMRLETLVDIFHIEHQEILIKVFKNELEYSLITAAIV